MCITYCVCVCVFVALVIQHAMCMCLPHSTVLFQYYLINGRIFGKKVIDRKVCALISSTNFVWNMFPSKKNWARYDQKCILVFTYSTRYSCQILMKLEFFQKCISNFEKISPVGAEIFHADRRTDMKLIVVFRNFANAPRKCKNLSNARTFLNLPCPRWVQLSLS
jgi:hypothetical protein